MDLLTIRSERYRTAQHIVAKAIGPRPVSPVTDSAPYQPAASIIAQCDRWAEARKGQREFDRRVRRLVDHVATEARCIEDRMVELGRAA